MTENYIIAAAGKWNEFILADHPSIDYASNPESLDSILKHVKPSYIFFLHWHWKISEQIWNKFECIVFHMTDLPYGRGGSPLQNLILSGHKKTKLTAISVEEGLDSGPIYLKKNLSLSGSAEEIYLRASHLSLTMIDEIISKKIKPTPQVGEIVKFNRRIPEDSLIPSNINLEELYDFIRMLDAPGYPKAFFEIKKIKIEFDKANYEKGILSARLKIS